MTVLACKALGGLLVAAAVPLVAFGLAIPSTGCMIAAFSLIVAATVVWGVR